MLIRAYPRAERGGVGGGWGPGASLTGTGSHKGLLPEERRPLTQAAAETSTAETRVTIIKTRSAVSKPAPGPVGNMAMNPCSDTIISKTKQTKGIGDQEPNKRFNCVPLTQVKAQVGSSRKQSTTNTTIDKTNMLSGQLVRHPVAVRSAMRRNQGSESNGPGFIVKQQTTTSTKLGTDPKLNQDLSQINSFSEIGE